MIKTVISSLIALTVVMMPVAAEAQNRGENGWEQRQNRSQNWNPGNHRRDRGVSTGAAIGIGLGAFVLGSVLTDRNNRNLDVNPQFDPRFNPWFDNRRTFCREIFTSGVDRYGDYYEKRITRCN